MKHTKLPWKVYELDGSIGVQPLDIQRGDICCTHDPIDNPKGANAFDTARPVTEGRANAQFIVKACNAHEELVSILKELIEVPNKKRPDRIWEETRHILAKLGY